MLVSRKRNTSSSPELTLNGIDLEPVSSLIFFRLFFTNMLMLYASIVHPRLEYAAPVWDPHLQKDCDKLENTQKFACKMAIKRWDLGYNELLNLTNLPTLADRRLHLKMCSMYKSVHDLSYFHPNNIAVPKSTRTYTGTFHTFQQPFAHTIVTASS